MALGSSTTEEADGFFVTGADPFTFGVKSGKIGLGPGRIEQCKVARDALANSGTVNSPWIPLPHTPLIPIHRLTEIPLRPNPIIVKVSQSVLCKVIASQSSLSNPFESFLFVLVDSRARTETAAER